MRDGDDLYFRPRASYRSFAGGNRPFHITGRHLLHKDDYFSFSGMANYPADVGTAGASGNYWSTQYDYDKRGWLSRTKMPTGTIYRTVHDGLGRAACTLVGTSDTDWNEQAADRCNQTLANLVKTSVYVFDNGGVGDSNLTQVTQIPNDGSTNRVQQNFFDWRHRLMASKSGVNSSGELDGTMTSRTG